MEKGARVGFLRNLQLYATTCSQYVRKLREAETKLSGGGGIEHLSGSSKQGCLYRFGPRTLRQTIASTLMRSSPSS